MPLEEARAHLLAQAVCQVGTERCPIDKAVGRVLARDVHSLVDVPPADNSAMDGYAVRLSDLAADKDTWLPVGPRIPAGVEAGALPAGTAARIFTGAEIPEGADAVVMQEKVTTSEGGVLIPAGVSAQQNIRPRGQDIARGSLVLPAGSRVSAVALGVLASAGLAEVEVFRPLRVAVLSTGDELVEPGRPLARGQIYNSNRYLVEALLHSMGMQVVTSGIVADTQSATESALCQAAENADVILTTGGVSVGEEDHVKAVIERLGRLDIWKINIKPGKPFAAGFVKDVPLYALPGNPGSALITFALLAQPCLLKAQGMRVPTPFCLPVKAGFSRTKAQGRDEFLRVACSTDGFVKPSGNQSSGTLSSLLQTDGLVRIPGGEIVQEGQQLMFYPLSALLQQ
ncbi:MAG: molybdopterin molybdotransferase MoeA [Oceanospirillales bacterium]|nr:molybdopterin molybdotransferase MoeA [Oceanospirillales bacterium]